MEDMTTLNENFLSCSICTDTYKDPCTIECGHTFCIECLTTLSITQGDATTDNTILCPVCNEMTKVPDPPRQIEEWTKQLESPLPMQGLLDTVTASTEQACFSCQPVGDKTAASTICRDCDVIFCDRCSRTHAAMPVLSSHLTSEIVRETKVALKREANCKEHDSIVEFCCRDCDQAICYKCCHAYHGQCDSVVALESMMQEMKDVIRQNWKELQVHLNDVRSTITQQQARIIEIRQNKTTIQSEIRSVSQEAMGVIKQKEKDLLDEIDEQNELTEKQTGQLRVQIKSGEVHQQMYQQYAHFIDQTVTSESQVDLYDMYQLCQSDEAATDIKSNTGSRSWLKKISFVDDFDENKADEYIKLGYLSMTGEDVDLACTPKLQTTIDISTREDTGNPSPYDVTVLMVNGVETLVVTDKHNNSLKSFYIERGQSQCRSLKLESNPYSVTKLTDNRVAVSFQSYSRFVIVQVEPDLVLHSTVTTKKAYTCLTAIDSSRLAGSRGFPFSMDILDLSGKVLTSLTSGSTGLSRTVIPSYTCITINGHLLIADDDSNSIYCLTPEGDIVFKYQPTGERALSGPRGITTTSSGDILVTDNFNHKIIQLTETGDYVRDILTSQDEIFLPFGICLHQNKLYVTEHHSSNFKLFELMLQ